MFYSTILNARTVQFQTVHNSYLIKYHPSQIPSDQSPLDQIYSESNPTQSNLFRIKSNKNRFQPKITLTQSVPIRLITTRINSHLINFRPNYFTPAHFPTESIPIRSVPNRISSNLNQIQFKLLSSTFVCYPFSVESNQ